MRSRLADVLSTAVEAQVTDGERLVWAASYAIAIDRGSDAVVAARTAALAIAKLREAAVRRSPDGHFVIAEIDERHFLDEMVSAP
jgi:hypothetical protein